MWCEQLKLKTSAAAAEDDNAMDESSESGDRDDRCGDIDDRFQHFAQLLYCCCLLLAGVFRPTHRWVAEQQLLDKSIGLTTVRLHYSLAVQAPPKLALIIHSQGVRKVLKLALDSSKTSTKNSKLTMRTTKRKRKRKAQGTAAGDDGDDDDYEGV